MIGEGYVVQMLQISESARAVGAEILGEQSEHQQLKKLREPGIVHQLANKLACSEQEVFSRFGERIFAKFKRPALPPFTFYHLRLLRDSAPVLAHLFGWTADDALKNLLNPDRMQKTLTRIDSTWDEDQSDAAELEVGLLLDEILVPNVAKAIEIAYGLGFNDWGTIIENEEWLEKGAVDTLRKYAAKQSWPEDDALRILAAILQDMDLGKPLNNVEEERTLDWLALTYLRQRLRFLSSRLLDQAIDLAEDAASRVPSTRSFGYLPAWIKMNEQGAIRRAIPYLAPEKKALSTLLRGQDYKILFKGNEEPSSMKQVLVVKEKTRTRFLSGATVGSFEVHCVLQGKQHPQAVLGCSDLPLPLYKHLTTAIPKLTGTDISSQGESLAQRLLNTEVLEQDVFLQVLRIALKELGSSIAQSMILCGIGLPISIQDIPGSEEIEYVQTDRGKVKKELPYKKLDAEKDLSFSNDSVSKVKEKYHIDDRELQMVSV